MYRCAKQRSEPSGDWRADPRGVNNRGGNQRSDGQGEITLTPLELIDRIVALIQPPRTHRHRYYGALAPNSPLRSAVTAIEMPAQQPTEYAPPTWQPAVLPDGLPTQAGAGDGAAGVTTVPVSPISPASEPQPMAPKHSPAHYLWAALIARIYEVLPLLCPICGGQMRIQ